ncbi:MAG TPA: hypothetical protein VGV59_17835 [Pyrinomonadaceae bacterium]|nr:hypothetical protein [Pyrinomonadaceae bacterium]
MTRRRRKGQVTVFHIMSANANKPHPYTSAAKLVGNQLSYRE